MHLTQVARHQNSSEKLASHSGSATRVRRGQKQLTPHSRSRNY